MMNKRWTTISLFFLLLLSLGACRQAPEPTPTPEKGADPVEVPEDPSAGAPSAQEQPSEEPPPEQVTVIEGQSSAVLISEVLTGADGANNHEFIELYNNGIEAVNLQGYSLWYLTREGQEETQLYSWDEAVDIPGLGHFLLVKEGESFGLFPDALYEAAVFESKGGLILRDAAEEVVDRLGWGEAPEGYFTGSPVSAVEKGASLERSPGGLLGNGFNSADNAADFVLRADPDPQNSGDPPAPLPDQRLVISLEYPDAVPPGAAFELLVKAENLSSEPVHGLQFSLPLAGYFSVNQLPEGAQAEDGRVVWSVDSLEPGESATHSLSLTTPMANVDTLFRDYYVASDELPRAYGELSLLQMDGSAIPIGVARSLPEGSLVTVEGLVTMYPGGFFAGSSSAKFYLEDETGGVQIFADGGLFDVAVDIGDRVRATGVTELFRDSLEVIPADNVADIIVLETNSIEPQPTAITVAENETDESVLGRLNVTEGVATRIEEFSYHYEVDLEDESGNQTLLYMEKDTGITDETLNLGSQYRVTGISELASGQRQLKPRLQSDIVEIFPPVLLLTASGPTNVLPGERMTVTVTAVNHTVAPLTNVQIRAESATGDRQEWVIPLLEGDGSSESVAYQVQAPANAAGIFEVGGLTAVADQWPEAVIAEPHEAYIGEGVPIWALQGDDARSPLIGERVTAVGQVTGAFPAMDGFFLQSLVPDGVAQSSDGIFVAFDNLSQQFKRGDVLQVTGRVREDAGQTILRVALPTDIILRPEDNIELIEPVVYDPPADPEEAALYNEALEGMLVTIESPAVVVGPTNLYGETMMVYEKWGKDLVRRTDDQNGFVMWVDDATFNTHDDQSTLPVAAALGDVFQNVTGPLGFTYGNYKIAPVTEPEIQYGEHPLPTVAEAAGNDFAVATFNVENLFDAQIPHPESPPRLSEEGYQQRLAQVAETIQLLGFPAVIALQEVENIGVLEELAAQPVLAGYGYTPALIEGNDSRGIDVGYLVRGDRATIEQIAVLDAPNALFSRPPLMLKVTVHLDSGDQQLILLNNHFLSLSAGEAQTEPVRNNQAAWNAEQVERLAAENPGAHIMVLGDLNSFYQTMPLETLQESGLRHAYEYVSDNEALPYTYIFEGAAQSIDHILMSPALFEKLSLVEALHTNADFPIPDPADSSPRRVSDHDPLLVVFSFD